MATIRISIPGGNSKVMVVAKFWSDYTNLPTQARWRDGEMKGGRLERVVAAEQGIYVDAIWSYLRITSTSSK